MTTVQYRIEVDVKCRIGLGSRSNWAVIIRNEINHSIIKFEELWYTLKYKMSYKCQTRNLQLQVHGVYTELRSTSSKQGEWIPYYAHLVRTALTKQTLSTSCLHLIEDSLCNYNNSTQSKRTWIGCKSLNYIILNLDYSYICRRLVQTELELFLVYFLS